MRVLVDNCLPAWLAEQLAVAGHDCVWVGNFGPDPGDEAIVAQALESGRVTLTLDKGIADEIFRASVSHGGVVLMRKTRPTQWVDVALRALRHERELERGAIVVADPLRTRIRL